jgi:hypothetical protein
VAAGAPAGEAARLALQPAQARRRPNFTALLAAMPPRAAAALAAFSSHCEALLAALPPEAVLLAVFPTLSQPYEKPTRRNPFGRLAGLPGSADTYAESSFVDGAPVFMANGSAGDFGFDSGGVAGGFRERGFDNYAGVWHANGCGLSYRPYRSSNDELGMGNGGCGAFPNTEGPDPNPYTFGFRMYVSQ